MHPTLSIITPVKNAAPWLAGCIQSGLGQNYQDWEWIFVDDHSTDNSAAIIAEFTGKDSRIKLFSNAGQGIIPALQQALSESSGHFITRMDADDLMPPGRLEKMRGRLQGLPPKTVVTGLVEYFSEAEVSPGYHKYQNWLNGILREGRHWENIYRECVVASPNWMMRRDELIKTGGFDGLEYPEDYDLVFRWYKNDFKIGLIPQVTLHWREHPGRTSRLSKHYNQKAFFRLKVQRFLELDYDSGKTLCLWGTGIKGKLSAKILRQAGVDFHWMGYFNDAERLINGNKVWSYQKIEDIKNPQLLLAIYPTGKYWTELQKYLGQIALNKAEDYWFL
ncbi:MAG: glycosyltransferase family 2 protein [Owenweeksia sp.]|nr:glycosyltransferase family 2 protein [Owenweeksia sp.]